MQTTTVTALPFGKHRGVPGPGLSELDLSRAAAFLEDLHVNPADDGLAGIFADWLDERGPTPVRLHHLPNWLRLAWLRGVPSGEGRGRLTAGWAVAMEMDRRFETTRYAAALDHWGSTTVAGRLCFVNEPYQYAADVLAQCRTLASLVGGVAAYARQSDWGHGTVRGLVFPPLKAE
jgi:uncharacterized protein (TIGR02996 family)